MPSGRTAGGAAPVQAGEVLATNQFKRSHVNSEKFWDKVLVLAATEEITATR